ncbi:hypothetical protein ZIOFF_058105 [Zingiber officinale]|uniref:ABC transmembrane type-1 domain-containing protein n=1 Tax=Zingiber officinale TaxID=94328 RepID=A0A8J5KCM9_ZINOF|nr:hypothetical protein ZIOFF_058105 [Zingiber officinale]
MTPNGALARDLQVPQNPRQLPPLPLRQPSEARPQAMGSSLRPSGRKKTREPKEENVMLGPTVREGEQVFGVAHIFSSFNDTFIHVTDLSGRETLVRITVSSMNMFDGNKIGFLVVVLNAIRLDFGWKRAKMHKSALKIRAYTYALHVLRDLLELKGDRGDISRETHEAIAMDLLGGKSNSGEGGEAISYIRTLYAFTNDTLAKYSYATSLQATLRYGIPISLVQGLGLDFTYGLTICSCALQLWVGRFLISNGKANGGEIITTLFVVILSSLGLNQAAINFYSFEQGRIAAYKLFKMISCSNSSLNQDGSTLATMQGNIEFRNVYFSYLSRPEILILSGFYQNVPARKTVPLVGRNDSRKSSIIPLMKRFYDLTLGEEPTLLSLSIKDNIAYGRSATSDQIEEASKTIHAHDFITSLEMGYETQVGRTGLSLIEEQKIKISITRVVLSNPSILLLDEVTSGLDFETEKVVQEALDILMLGRSTIIIARCLSLILLYI